MTRAKYNSIVFLLFVLSVLSSCTLFQNDPVGASLLSIKNSYEATVRTAGSAYINGSITREQLDKFVVEARKVYISYNALVTIHDIGSLTNPDDPKLISLRSSLDALERSILSLVGVK